MGTQAQLFESMFRVISPLLASRLAHAYAPKQEKKSFRQERRTEIAKAAALARWREE
jgi:hypothetical protein